MRVYLDHNATTPLRAEARDAMVGAMGILGNPSSVHREGRAAKAALEKARQEIASAFGADGAEVVFTSSATEAAAMALAGREISGAAFLVDRGRIAQYAHRAHHRVARFSPQGRRGVMVQIDTHQSSSTTENSDGTAGQGARPFCTMSDRRV